jgi:ATP-dependent Clp protease adapter protein ClpS
MNDALEVPLFAQVLIHNDEVTPYSFVVELLMTVLSKSENEARQIASSGTGGGPAIGGTYPAAVADAIVAACQSSIAQTAFPLKVSSRRIVNAPLRDNAVCSLCNSPRSEVQSLYAGKHGNICDACALRILPQLHTAVPQHAFSYVHDLLGWHFAGVKPEDIVTCSRRFPARVRADLQTALEQAFPEGVIRLVGIHSEGFHDPLDVATLLKKERGPRTPKSIAPLQYVDIDIGDPEPKPCLKNALWLIERGGVRCGILLCEGADPFTRTRFMLVEFAVPAGDIGQALAKDFLRQIESEIQRATSYRGKVLSLEQHSSYSGMSSGITVHKLPPVDRDEVILPPSTLDVLDRSIIAFVRQRARLRELGQSTKRGVLFYGPPGTGKTHTIRYLASQLPNHTTLMITAEQVGQLDEYVTLARLMAPSILVIEDVDLIARNRESMAATPTFAACGSWGSSEVQLNKLLNEMDGLREEADILFLLTTNRPQDLEEGLAARPGRIDQAIEFPLPDELGRKKLLDLYGANLTLSDELKSTIVAPTAGVSGAFIKELMRRAAQFAYERTSDRTVAEEEVTLALDEMLFSANKLNRRLLGGSQP